MRALVLAAGLGTRLQPLTTNMPKALVEVAGKPLIEHVIFRLWSSGITNIVVNTHHHALQLIDYLAKFKLKGLEISISDETDELLDTGGAIMHARHLLDTGDPFLVHNVDIITNLDYGRMLETHHSGNYTATLAVRHRHTSRSLLVDKAEQLCGWKNHETGETRICYKAEYSELAFSGVHILSPMVFNLMPEGRFSIIDFYLEMASKGMRIRCHPHDSDFWFDLGRLEQLDEAEKLLRDLA